MARRIGWLALGVLSGPFVAFLTLAVGCAMPWQLLGTMCGHNIYASAALIAVAAWAIVVVAYGIRCALRLVR